MKGLVILIVLLLPAGRPGWLTDFSLAKKTASETNRMILLNFSGSDWCAPCIRLNKEIFLSDAFKKFSDSSLVLLNADFPRLKKNQLGKSQQTQNDALAESYNPEGKFPFTVLLDAKGKRIAIWDGYPNISPEAFVDQLKSYCNAAK